ncbi:helix-turn-helix domain-containing protein [Scandinavium goeteborgense]|uniref:helix-turn-helix domain-containing protein n=1 Tax=Scandinavium goeteborgense TaxID=1851514 RepID=UPI001062041B|nr:helix-turn-helix domain-containing protein [Scandinavium goeteborgense]
MLGPWSHLCHRDHGPTLLLGPWSHPAIGTVVPPCYRDCGPTLLLGPWSHPAIGTVVPPCHRDRGPKVFKFRFRLDSQQEHDMRRFAGEWCFVFNRGMASKNEIHELAKAP